MTGKQDVINRRTIRVDHNKNRIYDIKSKNLQSTPRENREDTEMNDKTCILYVISSKLQNDD